jgi:3-oxoadipate enol-lactonase
VTVVFLGGLGTTSAMWEPQRSLFADAVFLDLPGHGAAPVPDGPVRVADIGGHVLELVDGPFAFVGLSLGGMVGMWLAANAPDRVERLVLACTGAKLGSREIYFERAAVARAEGLEGLAEASRERWFTPGFRQSAAADRVVELFKTVPPEGYATCAEAVGDFDFRGELHRIAAPTVVVWGEEDPVATAEVVETLVTGISVARAIRISHASHLASLEQPEAFNEAVKEAIA